MGRFLSTVLNGLIILIVLVVFVSSAGKSGNQIATSQTDTSGNSDSTNSQPEVISASESSVPDMATATAQASPIDGTVAAPISPPDETALVGAIAQARQDWAAAANDMQQADIAKRLLNRINVALGKAWAKHWVGTVEDVGGNLTEGGVRLSISIDDGTTITTNLDDGEDIGDGFSTIIQNNSPIYKVIYNLSVGQKVEFTANLKKLWTDDPDLLVHRARIIASFADIRPLQ